MQLVIAVRPCDEITDRFNPVTVPRSGCLCLELQPRRERMWLVE